jgi:hypothetical protein
MRTTASNSTPVVGGDLDRARRAVVQLGDAGEGEGLLAGEAEGLGVLALRELEREDAHADEVGAVDALVGLGDDGLDAEEGRALGRPVTGRAGAVLLAGQDDQRDALLDEEMPSRAATSRAAWLVCLSAVTAVSQCGRDSPRVPRPGCVTDGQADAGT